MEPPPGSTGRGERAGGGRVAPSLAACSGSGRGESHGLGLPLPLDVVLSGDPLRAVVASATSTGALFDLGKPAEERGGAAEPAEAAAVAGLAAANTPAGLAAAGFGGLAATAAGFAMAACEGSFLDARREEVAAAASDSEELEAARRLCSSVALSFLTGAPVT